MDNAVKTGGIKNLNVEAWLLFSQPIKISGYAPGLGGGDFSNIR